MTYCTLQKLIDKFGAEELAQLADHDIPRIVTGEMLQAYADGDISAYTAEEQASINKAAGIIESVIDDVDSTIDAYLQSRYDLPLSDVPLSVTRVARDLVRYELYDDNAPEQIETRYKDAVKFMEAVASGKVNLGIGQSGSKPKPQDAAHMESDGKVFSRDNGGFI